MFLVKRIKAVEDDLQVAIDAGDAALDTRVDTLETVSLGVSSNISFSTSSTTFVDVTNSSVAFTKTRAHPIILALLPYSTTPADVLNDATGSNGIVIELAINRNGTNIGVMQATFGTAAGGISDMGLPPGAYWMIDNPGLGAYTYKVQARLVSGTGTAVLAGVRLHVIGL